MHNILVTPGDGIGPEVIDATRRVLGWFTNKRSFAVNIDEALVGGTAFEQTGRSDPDETIAKAKKADAVLFGAVGGPQWDSLPFHQKPERGLLRLRKDLALFANLRPALCFDALKDASSLKPEIVAGLDILIVRELTGGVYFGEPKETTTLPDGQKRAVDTQVYTTSEIERIARVAFELARVRGNRVASAEKANVMVTGVLWREVVTKVHREEFSDVELTHILADNAAMQLVRNPKQFDVMVKGLANPISCILSFAMALRYSFDRKDDAVLLEKAVDTVLAEGYRTGDIMQPGMNQVGTTAMTDAILKVLDKVV
jgi:3-isopropylmalate dehydrogenase